MSTKYQSLCFVILIMVELTFVYINEAKNFNDKNAPCKLKDGSIVADTYCDKSCATHADPANNYCDNGRKCCACVFYPSTKSGAPSEFTGQIINGHGICSKKRYEDQTDVTIRQAPKVPNDYSPDYALFLK